VMIYSQSFQIENWGGKLETSLRKCRSVFDAVTVDSEEVI